MTSAKQTSYQDPSMIYLLDWDKLEIMDGVLYRRGTVSGEAYLQLVLYDTLLEDLFLALHDDLGHQGRDRTISLFKQVSFDLVVMNFVVNYEVIFIL